jgi:hypothetical protein
MKTSKQKTALFLFSLSICVFHVDQTGIYAQFVKIEACRLAKAKNTLENQAQNIVLEILFTMEKENNYVELIPDNTNHIKSARATVLSESKKKVIYYNPTAVNRGRISKFRKTLFFVSQAFQNMGILAKKHIYDPRRIPQTGRQQMDRDRILATNGFLRI